MKCFKIERIVRDLRLLKPNSIHLEEINFSRREAVCIDFFKEKTHFGGVSPHLLIATQTLNLQDLEKGTIDSGSGPEQFQNHLTLAVFDLKDHQLLHHRMIPLFQPMSNKTISCTSFLLIKEIYYLPNNKCLLCYEEIQKVIERNGLHSRKTKTRLRAGNESRSERRTFVSYIDFKTQLENIKMNRIEVSLDTWDTELLDESPPLSFRHKKYVKFSANRDFLVLRSATNLIHVIRTADLVHIKLENLHLYSRGVVEIYERNTLISDFAIYEDTQIDLWKKSVILAFTTFDLSKKRRGLIQLEIKKVDFPHSSVATIDSRFDKKQDITEVKLLGDLDLTQLSANEVCCLLVGEQEFRIQERELPLYKGRSLLYRIKLKENTTILRPLILNLQAVSTESEQQQQADIEFSKQVEQDQFSAVTALKTSVALVNIYADSGLPTKFIKAIVINEGRPCELTFLRFNSNGYTFRNCLNIIDPEENNNPYKFSQTLNRNLNDHLHNGENDVAGSNQYEGFRCSRFISPCYVADSLNSGSEKEFARELIFSLFDQSHGKLALYSIKAFNQKPKSAAIISQKSDDSLNKAKNYQTTQIQHPNPHVHYNENKNLENLDDESQAKITSSKPRRQKGKPFKG